MVDTFDPHEPWDPPEWYVRHFDPEDYDENQSTHFIVQTEWTSARCN